MEEIGTESLAITVIGSLLIGGFCGGLARNLFKLVAFLIGIEIAFITYLQHLELIDINWSNIETIIEDAISLVTGGSVSDGAFTKGGAVVGGFVIGFLIGFRFV